MVKGGCVGVVAVHRDGIRLLVEPVVLVQPVNRVPVGKLVALLALIVLHDLQPLGGQLVLVTCLADLDGVLEGGLEGALGHRVTQGGWDGLHSVAFEALLDLALLLA